MRNRNGKSRGLKIVLVACLIAFCSSLSFAADSITGVVRDRTDGQPAVGDEVLLLDPGHGAQEEARAKTDSQGTFNLALHHTGAQYLVRVIHQGVNYDLRAAAGAAISINVYDAASTVQGITGGIEIIRAGTNGNQLHVSEMVEIRNNSNPPITRSGERTFEVYLPANAKIDSVLAAGPENIGTMISAAPASSGLGHYTVNFPLRPGATKFAFNYDLPYSGHAVFRTRSVYPLQQLAVMIPSSMTFKSPSAAFQVLPVGADRYRVEAAEQVNAGEGPQFEIAGVGALPAMQAPAQAQMSRPAALSVLRRRRLRSARRSLLTAQAHWAWLACQNRRLPHRGCDGGLLAQPLRCCSALRDFWLGIDRSGSSAFGLPPRKWPAKTRKRHCLW